MPDCFGALMMGMDASQVVTREAQSLATGANEGRRFVSSQAYREWPYPNCGDVHQPPRPALQGSNRISVALFFFEHELNELTRIYKEL